MCIWSVHNSKSLLIYIFSIPPTDSIKEYLEPHVDNESVLTLILLLSNPRKDFTGAQLLFEHFDTDFDMCSNSTDTVCLDQGPSYSPREGWYSDWRFVNLDQGDAVIFRGSQLEHTISPLLSGTRSILQIELSVDDFDEDE